MQQNWFKWLVITAVIGTTLSVCQAGGIRKRKIKKLFKHSAIFNTHFTGFALYDLDKAQTICEINADRYFTPASNVKLLTFYTCLKMLGDSIPGLHYTVKGDSLLFWGMGDPSFLHPDLKGTNAYHFLKQANKKLYYCPNPSPIPTYGAGWAWDDYNDYYQAEINDLPVAANLVEIYADDNNQLQTKPARFKANLTADSNYHPERFNIKRALLNNALNYPSMRPPKGFKQFIPWQTGNALTVSLLQDTLKKQIGLLSRPLPTDAKIIYNAVADTVYRHMLQPSDNFIAEQLLLVCSAVKYGYLNADSVRQYALNNFMADLPDKPQWNDGSGLSRLNLLTPRSIIALLNKILIEVKDEQLLRSLFPIGGVTGTLKLAYKTDHGQPFVWAKTGSLSNNYNQSGYLVTRKGRRLAFCLMNNNYVESTKTIRDEMVRVMTYIHDNF